WSRVRGAQLLVGGLVFARKKLVPATARAVTTPPPGHPTSPDPRKSLPFEKTPASNDRASANELVALATTGSPKSARAAPSAINRRLTGVAIEPLPPNEWCA